MQKWVQKQAEDVGPVGNGAMCCLRSHVDSNVTLIKLQKQLADRSNAVAEMEARFLQLQDVRYA